MNIDKDTNGKLLTIGQVCEKIGVSKTWLYKKATAKIIPHYRIGGILRFSEREINEWLGIHHVDGCQKV